MEIDNVDYDRVLEYPVFLLVMISINQGRNFFIQCSITLLNGYTANLVRLFSMLWLLQFRFEPYRFSCKLRLKA